jgi:hypothetical protein
MTHRRVVAAALAYDFAPDDAPLLAERDWALATAQLVDDIAGTPLAGPFRVHVVLPGAQDEVGQDGARWRRVERGIAVKIGADGTFALVARPWLRFTPWGAPATVSVAVDADGFAPLTITFPVVYDQRTIAAPPAAIGDRTVVLNSTVGLVAGQALLLGPAALPQYNRVRGLGAGNQVTLEAGLLSVQNIGDPLFPDTFATPPPVVATLRRRPVTILGRVVVRDTTANTSTPVANASVTVTDFWRTRTAVVANPANGSMTDPVPALREFAVSVAPGALGRRAAGAGAGTLNLPSAGDDRTLVRPAAAGEPRVEVRPRQNLVPSPSPLANRLLWIDADDPSAAEYQTLATVDPPGVAEEPARLGLDFPLARGHREGARVERTLAPLLLPPPTLALRAAAEPGDVCLFFDAPAGPPLPPPQALFLTGGGAADEFQRYAEFSVLSDAEGFFRLPPIHRMARVALTVDDGLGNVLPPIEIDPEYGETEHRVDAVYQV